MRHYLRLWWRFAAMAFAREAEYRINFLVSIGEGLLQAGIAVVSLLLVYRFTDEIAGWSQAEVLLLVGIYRLAEGLINLQIAPNMLEVSGAIRRGDLDGLLLRPVASQFLVSARLLNLSEGFNALVGLILVIGAGQAAGARWGVGEVALAAAFLLCGLLLLYALWFAIVTLSFWLVQVDSLDQLFYTLFEAARYPVAFFGTPVRALLTFVVPVAFATTFPAEALLGAADPRMLAAGVGMALLALLLTNRFWRYAVRHYSSASS
jgi:ABC-2 type transport system permease protein